MTNYYEDMYKTYGNEPVTKRIKALIKKYIIIDAGQLIIGVIGLICMFVF